MNSTPYPVVVKLHDRLLAVEELNRGLPLAARNAVDYTRSVIKGMSSDSRTRLMRMLATINRPDPGWFVTLTYREWVDDFQVWKAHLHRLLMAAKRRYPNLCGVWRLEFQERGAPHFHLLLWLGREEDTETLRVWVRDRWAKAIGDESKAALTHGTTVEGIRDFRNCGFYLSLYQAKDQQDRKDIQTGREWGTIQPSLLQTEPIREACLTREKVRLLRRVVRNAHRARNRSSFRRSRYWISLGKEERSFSMMLDFPKAKLLLEWVQAQEWMKRSRPPAVIYAPCSLVVPAERCPF